MSNLLLSVTHVNHTYFSAIQADTSEKVTVVEMQTLHGHSKQSGLSLVTYLETKVTDKHAIYVACSKTKTGNFSTFQKDYVVAANFLPKLQ